MEGRTQSGGGGGSNKQTDDARKPTSFICSYVHPSANTRHKRSPLSQPSRPWRQRRLGETTDCSCRHTGPSPPAGKRTESVVPFSIQSLKTWLPLWKHSVQQHLFGHLCCFPAKCPFGNVVLSEAIISLTNKLLAHMQIKYYFLYVPSCAQKGWHSKGKCCVSVMSKFCNFDITDFGKNLP